VSAYAAHSDVTEQSAAGRALLCLNLDYEALAHDQSDANATVCLDCHYTDI
jgi:hypothetical protein